MQRPFPAAFLALFVIIVAPSYGQNANSSPAPKSAPTPTVDTSHSAPESPTIPANAPQMSKQTRFEIIRDFETQLVYSRAQFPMGSKGLKLKDGIATPSGQELQQLITLWGPSIKPGDPAHISFVRIKDNYIHFDLNGGAVHRKKWYETSRWGEQTALLCPYPGTSRPTIPMEVISMCTSTSMFPR